MATKKRSAEQDVVRLLKRLEANKVSKRQLDSVANVVRKFSPSVIKDAFNEVKTGDIGFFERKGLVAGLTKIEEKKRAAGKKKKAQKKSKR